MARALFDYGAMQDIAHDLLAMFGGGEQQLTFRRISHVVADYDPTTGDQPVTPTTYDVTAVVVNIEKDSSSQKLDDAETDLTLENQRFVYVSAADLTITPEPGDECDFQGDTWRVMSANRVQPSPGSVVLYKVRVERA